MGTYDVRRGDGEIVVNAPPTVVFDLISGEDWEWTSQFDRAVARQELAFTMKGSFFKDNSAEATFVIVPLNEVETVICVEGSRGALMEAMGANLLNVGVKKFRNKVLDSVEAILRSV